MKLADFSARELAEWARRARSLAAPVELHVLAQSWELRCGDLRPLRIDPGGWWATRAAAPPTQEHPPLLGVGAALNPDGADLFHRQRRAIGAAGEAARSRNASIGENAVEAAVSAYLAAMREDPRG